MKTFALPATCCAVALLAIAPALGDPPTIVQIEEDWQVEIATPDPEGHAPQIITAMSSTGELADVHAVFELNHASLPSYTAGGMQLQLWSGDVNLDHRNSPKFGVLAVENEVITYTMRMSLDGNVVAFEVDHGNSTTWGTFGGQGYLKTSITTNQTSLANYRSSVSVANSHIGFAKHRVKKFVLKRVRYYTAGGYYATDPTDRIVHELEADD